MHQTGRERRDFCSTLGPSMALSEHEALASLKILIAMARADGVMHDKERTVLESALVDVELPDGASVKELLDTPPDLEGAVAALASEEAREHAYGAAFALARADGQVAGSERNLLDRLRRDLRISDAAHGRLEKLFADLDADDAPPSQPVVDQKARDLAIVSETRKCAIFCAVLGAFPVPGVAIATDLAAAGLQVGLARQIAQLYGRDFDRNAARSLLGRFGIGTGARIAVTNLLKVFPGWGSAAGAVAGYASTYAVGHTMREYFEGRGELDIDSLRDAFKKANKAGRVAYAEDRQEVEEKLRENQARLEKLQDRLVKGEITGSEFRKAVAQGS